MTIDLSHVLPEMHRRELLPHDHLAVFCVASVARGWANPKSDFDFHVIVQNAYTGPYTRTVQVGVSPDFVPALKLQVNGRRWELKYWLDDQVEQMLDKVSWARYDALTAKRSTLGIAEEVALERILSCIPLSGEEWIEDRQRRLEGSAFKDFALGRSILEATASIEDAVGQIAAGDLASAVLSARRVLGFSVDGLLETYEVYGSEQPKWRARRFRDAAPTELSFEAYWAWETMRDLDRDDPTPWVEGVVELGRELVALAEAAVAAGAGARSAAGV